MRSVLEPVGSRRRTADNRRRLADVVRETLLNLAAIGGAICILLTLAAVFFHITLIMFKTGSMSPGIPAGSLAIVREVPASEVRTGDVVTVDRPGQLPVTHRVTSSRMVDGATAVLTLKGDANPVEDPAPYTVSKVRTVLYSVPGIAYVVAGASSPWVLGGTTVAVSALVTWALWPRPERAPRARIKARR
jgi:signal peptidase